MQKDNQNIAQPGVLRFAYNTNEDDNFHSRFLIQMSQIRGCVYKKDQHLKYDKSYSPIFQNLLEAKFAKEHCQNLTVAFESCR